MACSHERASESVDRDDPAPVLERYEKPTMRTIELAAYEVLGTCGQPDATEFC